MLINITGGPDLTLTEVYEAADIVYKACDSENVNVIFGTVICEDMTNEVRITVLATGFDAIERPRVNRRPRLRPRSARTVRGPRPERGAAADRSQSHTRGRTGHPGLPEETVSRGNLCSGAPLLIFRHFNAEMRKYRMAGGSDSPGLFGNEVSGAWTILANLLNSCNGGM